jgi:hypothetical protein
MQLVDESNRGGLPQPGRLDRAFVGSGRNGQIRTADLPLRRRPLYPAELRPHFVCVSHSILNGQGHYVLPDIRSELHAVEMHLLHPAVRRANCRLKILSCGRHTEHTPSCRLQSPMG